MMLNPSEGYNGALNRPRNRSFVTVEVVLCIFSCGVAMQEQSLAFVPTRREIRIECRRIQKTWTRQDERNRRGCVYDEDFEWELKFAEVSLGTMDGDGR